jgi:hypothetical protein
MSAYRTAPAGSLPVAVALLCAGCGARFERRSSAETFRCEACGTEQAVSRDDPLPTTAPMRVVRSVPAGYTTLVPFSTSIGFGDTSMGLTLACAGAEVVLSLDINSGVVQGLSLFAPAPGLPTMTLRSETEADVRAKARRVAREVQTGDAAFDGKVFIESASADEDVLAPLSSPTVRAAVLSLLATCASVDFTKEGATAKAPGDQKTFAPDRLAQLVVALRVIAGAPRTVAPTAAKRGASVAWIVVAGLGFPAFVLVVVGFAVYEPVSAAPLVAGAAAGVAMALATWPLFTLALRGRSTSRDDIDNARWASLVTGPLAGIASLVLVNGVLDRSDPRRHELVAVEVRRDDDRDDTALVTARGDEPGVGEHTYPFDDPKHRLVLPATVTVTWRDGALGFRWEAAPATCHTPDGEPAK